MDLGNNVTDDLDEMKNPKCIPLSPLDCRIADARNLPVHIVKHSHTLPIFIFVGIWFSCPPPERQPRLADVLRFVVLGYCSTRGWHTSWRRLTYMKLETIFSFCIPWE